MDPNSTAVLTEVIAKLQGLLGQGPNSAPAGPKEAAIPSFDSAFSLVLEKAKTLSPEIQKLTSIYQSAAKAMKQILGFSTTSKKFSPAQQQKLKQKFLNLSKETEDLQKQHADYIDHSRTVRELLSTTFWVFVPTPQFLLKGAIESADFCAIKFQKRKNLDHNEWYKLLQTAVKNLQKFVLEGYPTGISFNFNGGDNWSLIIDGSAPPASQLKKQPTKQAEVKVPAGEVKKAKKKQLIGQTFTISNYENQNIEFKPEQLQMKHGVYLQNSKGLVLTITSKFKSLVVSKCEKVVLKIKSCVSGVEIVGSKDVTVIVGEKTPSISVDTSQIVKIILNEQNLDCDVVSSKASQLTISYEKLDGDESKAFLVGQQLITKWDSKNGTFKTSVYDKFL